MNSYQAEQKYCHYMCNPQTCCSICHRNITRSIVSGCTGGKNTKIDSLQNGTPMALVHIGNTTCVGKLSITQSRGNDHAQWKCNLFDFSITLPNTMSRYVTSSELRTWVITQVRHIQPTFTNMSGHYEE